MILYQFHWAELIYVLDKRQDILKTRNTLGRQQRRREKFFGYNADERNAELNKNA